MKEKIIKHFEEKGIEVDKTLLRYLDGDVELTDQDEFMHPMETYPLHHNESWYFNFIDTSNNVYCVSRFSFELGKKRSLLLFILVIDGKINTYFNAVPMEKLPADLRFDKRLKYKCIKPMQEWNIRFEDRKYKLDMNLRGRFPVFNSASAEDPLETLEKYGIEILDVAAQRHYEQAMVATGELTFKRGKKSGEVRIINCLGHRDHSWGMRDWVNIDAWNWVAAQFEDETINLVRSQVIGKNPQAGYVSTENGNIPIKNIEVTTQTKEDEKTPVSSEFIFTDKNGRTRTLNSRTIFSMTLPLPSEKGLTEIFEQVAEFECEGKQGIGISEYLISTRT